MRKLIKMIILALTLISLTASAFSATTVEKTRLLNKIVSDSSSQAKLFALKAPMGQFIGELQERWQFPSDHLPIGMTIDGMNIASWNVLNAAYMDWIDKNTQGLSHSQIRQEHVLVNEEGLTIRDQHVVNEILSMLNHPTHPKSILSLQECGAPFLKELQKKLPTNFAIIYSDALNAEDQNVVIFNKDKLSYDPAHSEMTTGIFSEQQSRSVMNLIFINTDNQKEIRLINAHLPGDPTKPAAQEFANFVASQASDILTIAGGDMNFNEVIMQDAFEKVLAPSMHFQIVAPYCTNAGLDFRSKSIDHFFVISANDEKARKAKPEEVLTGLQKTVDLLQSSRSLIAN